MHFGDLFKQFMQEKRRTDQQLSDLSGVPKFTIVSWREGRTKRPRNVDDLLSVAQALNLTLAEGDQLLRVAGHATITERIAAAEREQNEMLIAQLRYWIEQPAPPPAPPEQTLSAFQAKPAQFQAPPAVEHFTGRQPLIEEIETYLLGNEGRVATLVGMGGIGKSAIANRLAYQLRDHFPDGIFWVDLRHLAERQDNIDSFLISYIAAIIQTFAPGFDQTENIDLLSAQLRNIMANNRLLLVIDNVEAAQQLKPFLPPSEGHSKVIVTTRRKLMSLSDAFDFEIPILAEQEALDLLQRYVAKRRLTLEADHAKTLCEFLGYLPLAIQIVASDLAGTDDITVEEYLDLLVDEKERLVENLENASRGVRATFELSYKRLPLEMQPLFANLILFKGLDFSSEAVIATFGLRSINAKKLLSHLHRVSLLERGRPPLDGGSARYQFHPLLKQFAREKLSQFSTLTPTFHSNAARYFLDLAHRFRYERFDILSYEWENCMEGLLWALQRGNVDLVLRGIEGLTAIRLGIFGFLDSRAHWRDGVHFLTDLLDLMAEQLTIEQTAMLKIKLGAFYYRLGDLNKAQAALIAGRWLLEAEEKVDWTETRLAQMYAADIMARIALERDHMDEVMALSTDAVTGLSNYLSEQAAQRHALPEHESLILRAEAGYASIRHAEMLARFGDLDAALAEAEQGYAQLPAELSSALAVGNAVLGNINFHQGRIEKALSYWRSGLEISEKIGDLRRALTFSFNIAVVTSQYGDFKQSIPIQKRAIDSFQRMGDVRNAAINMSNLGLDLIYTDQFELAEEYLNRSRGIAESYDLNDLKIRVLVNLYQLALSMEDIEAAATLESEIYRFENKLAFQEFKNELRYLKGLRLYLQEEYESSIELLEALLDSHTVSSFERSRYVRLLGQLYDAVDKAEDSEQLYLQGLELSQKFGYHLEQAETELVLGTHLLKRDRLADGRALFDRAKRYYERQEIDSKIALIATLESRYLDQAV